MKQSLLFTKTSKTVSAEETSLNAQFLIKGGFVDKLSAGVYTMLPLGFRVYKKIEQIIREEINSIGGQEVFMPSLCPNENWKKTGSYKNIFTKAGIGDQTYLTYASGGTFSKYSHEFQTLTGAGEDYIYICDKCRVAINREILEDQKNKCPECGNNKLREEKAVEVGNIFKLSTKFSDPFDLFYIDKDNNKKAVIMGCYGIGLQRLMGTIVEVSHDIQGIIWPESVAPYRVHLISLKQDKESDKIYNNLLDAGIEVLYDDRDISFGAKFADADLIGCPYRIIVSTKTLEQDSVEFKKRTEKSSELVKKDNILKIFK